MYRMTKGIPIIMLCFAAIEKARNMAASIKSCLLIKAKPKKNNATGMRSTWPCQYVIKITKGESQ